MTIHSNTNEVINNLIAKFQSIEAAKVSEYIAENMIGQVHRRIHNEGLDATGSPIGTYSKGYMKVRTGEYATNPTFSKGKNKGKVKPGGVFTKGKHKGEERPKHNRTNDTEAVASLSRQAENDFSVQPAENNLWGLGYSNELNFAKALFVENTYKKKIFACTPKEETDCTGLTDQFVGKALNG